MDNKIKSFSEMGISKDDQLAGLKLPIANILNREILIKAFRIDKSLYPNEGNGMRLTLQIEVDDIDRVIFTSSIIIQDQIKQVANDDFPFKATIVPLTPRGYKLT